MEMRGSVRISDNRLKTMKDDPRLQEALKLICLCHDIYVDKEGDKETYNSSSPD